MSPPEGTLRWRDMKTKFPGNPVNEFEQSEHGIKFEYVHLVSKHHVFKFAKLDRHVQMTTARLKI